MDTSKYTSEILKRRDQERQACKRLSHHLGQSDANMIQILTSFQNHAVRLCRGEFSHYSRPQHLSQTPIGKVRVEHTLPSAVKV